jgi:hypothetical protein
MVDELTRRVGELEARDLAQLRTIAEQRARIAELARQALARNTEKVLQPAKLLGDLAAVGIVYDHARNTWNGRKKLTDALYDWAVNLAVDVEEMKNEAADAVTG